MKRKDYKEKKPQELAAHARIVDAPLWRSSCVCGLKKGRQDGGGKIDHWGGGEIREGVGCQACVWAQRMKGGKRGRNERQDKGERERERAIETFVVFCPSQRQRMKPLFPGSVANDPSTEKKNNHFYQIGITAPPRTLPSFLHFKHFGGLDIFSPINLIQSLFFKINK